MAFDISVGYVVVEMYDPSPPEANCDVSAGGVLFRAQGIPVGECIASGISSHMNVFLDDGGVMMVVRRSWSASGDCLGGGWEDEELSSGPSTCSSAGGDVGRSFFSSSSTHYKEIGLAGGYQLSFEQGCGLQLPSWSWLAHGVCVKGMQLTCDDYIFNYLVSNNGETCIGQTTESDGETAECIGEDRGWGGAVPSGQSPVTHTYECTAVPAAPTPMPTFLHGETMVEFETGVVLVNATADEFLADQASQTALIAATSESMPGVTTQDITITSVEQNGQSNNPARSLFIRELVYSTGETKNLIMVNMHVGTTSEAVFGCLPATNTTNSTCGPPEDTFTFLTDHLKDSISCGNFSQSLHTQSGNFEATATQAVTDAAPVKSNMYIAAYETTSSPTAAPTPEPLMTDWVAVGGISADVATAVGVMCGFVALMIIGCIYRYRVGNEKFTRESFWVAHDSKTAYIPGMFDKFTGAFSGRMSEMYRDTMAPSAGVEMYASGSIVKNPMSLNVDVSDSASSGPSSSTNPMNNDERSPTKAPSGHVDVETPPARRGSKTLFM